MTLGQEAGVVSIERLTAADRMMLWPDEVWPQDIGALALLDGAALLDPDGRFRIEAVMDWLEGRLHLTPRLRQLLQVPPRRLGGPLWVDHPGFDLRDHLHVVRLQPPGDEAQLLRATEEVRRRRLDRTRPLWEMTFFLGLPDRRVGLYVRTHHAIADGIAGVAMLGAFLDVTPDATAAPRQAWPAYPAPTTGELRADHLRRRTEGWGRSLSTLAHPIRSLRDVRAAWPAIREILAEETVPATSLYRMVGPDRNLALVRSSLDLFKEVAHRHEAKVNDVLLASIAGGLRELLGARGEPVEGVVVRIYVPVTLRHGDFAQARGNLIGQMVVPLPVGRSDPGQRLRQIAAETARRKARVRPDLGKVPSRGLAGRMVLKLIDRQHVNVTSADLPGPPIPLYLAGARLLEVFPMLPLIGSVSLGVGALSYAGQLNIMAVADLASCPDLDVFARGVRKELLAMAESVGMAPSGAELSRGLSESLVGAV
jgi:diacylglycerol O-acyltransferase / wax synthase